MSGCYCKATAFGTGMPHGSHSPPNLASLSYKAMPKSAVEPSDTHPANE